MVRRARIKTTILIILLILLLTGGALALLYFVDFDVPVQQGTPVSGLVINEVVSSNSTVRDDYGLAPDWVELYNGSNARIDLSGYGLSDNAGNPFRYTFPQDAAIEPGGYLIIWAAGEETEQRAGLRAPFALSKNGETVTLVSPAGALIQSLTLPELPEDMSWGRTEQGSYAYFGQPTPGAANNTPHSDTPTRSDAASDSAVKLNELMVDNEYSVMDADGDHSDWVELVNTGAGSISLAGYALSDDPGSRMKWHLPDITLEPGEYLVVFLSGKDRTGAELHTSFRIGSDEDSVLLSDAGGLLIDVITLPQRDIPGNVSYGRSAGNPGEYLYYPTPTPGYPNDTKGFTVIDEALRMDGIYISEVQATGQPRAKKPDWIEIYNSTGEDINLEGYGLSDSKNDPFRFTFPDVTIEAGAYLVVETGRHAAAALSATFSIAASGEAVYLYNPQGVAVDSFTTGYLKAGVTSGRAPGDDSGDRVFFTTATKGAANDTAALSSYTAQPRFSQGGGYADGPVQVSITSASENAAIHYTMDGSKPTASSPAYSGPVTIEKTATLRAIAYVDGLLPSDVTSATYLIEIPHDIPVVCIASDDDGLFGHQNGIFAKGPGYTEELPHTGANYWKDWEREISFEFYEKDGTLGVQFDAGLQVHGQYSRAEAQKSMAVHLRGAYGQSEVAYPFFRDYDVTTFSSFLLRTSGQDWDSTKIRDAFFAQAVKGVMDLDYMEYRPVALYINGQYWGLYNMREKVNEDYISNHYGIDGHNIDMIKGNNNALTGDNEAFQTLRSYMKSRNLSNQDVYDYVESQVDVYNFMDYAIVETYFNNTDTGNIKFWKPRDGEGKWRWILFDLDWGMYASGHSWNSISAFFNSAGGHGYNNYFYTHMQIGLIQNEAFLDEFIERYAYHINTTFDPDRLCDIVDQMAAEIRTEMTRHCARWGRPASASRWEQNIEDLKFRLGERPELAMRHLKSRFNISSARMNELFPNS